MMETLIGLALKSLVVAGVTLGLLHLTRRRSAADRSWIAHLGLFALVALPLGSLALPALSIEVPAVLPAEAPAPLPAATVVPTAADPFVATSAPAVAAAAPSIDWTPYAYAVPLVALLLVTLVALLRLFGLRGRAQVLVDPVWLSALAHAQRRMGFKNGTALLTSSELRSPISWGLMRPVILLNDEALGASDEAEAIIAHELAHVARLDWAKLMLARVATAIFWFNPLAWMLAREAHQLREEAADDAVLAADIADTDYAQLLVGVARHECRGLLLGAHGISPGKGSLTRRVRRVLDSSLARTPGSRSWVTGFAAGMLVMAAPLAALTLGPKERLPEDTLIGKTDIEGRPLAARPQHRATPGDSADPAVAPVVALATSSAVQAAIHATAGLAHPHPDWSEAEEAARDAAIEADKARDEGRAARRAARRAGRDAIDTAIEMKVMGVTPDYAAAIRSAGPQFRALGSDEIIELKVKGVTPQFVRALAEAGYRNESADAIGDAAIMGVTPTFIREMSAAGYRGLSLDDLTEMRAMGVGRAFIDQVRRTGASPTSKQLIRMRAHGVKPHDLPPPPKSPPAAAPPTAPPAPPAQR